MHTHPGFLAMKQPILYHIWPRFQRAKLGTFQGKRPKAGLAHAQLSNWSHTSENIDIPTGPMHSDSQLLNRTKKTEKLSVTQRG